MSALTLNPLNGLVRERNGAKNNHWVTPALGCLFRARGKQGDMASALRNPNAASLGSQIEECREFVFGLEGAERHGFDESRDINLANKLAIINPPLHGDEAPSPRFTAV